MSVIKPVYSDIVVSYIKECVRQQKLRPGQKVSDISVATKLNISRAPVREGLNRLTGEGLLVSGPHHGKRVNAFSMQEIQDAYTLGGAICGVTVASCLSSYTKKDIAELELYADKLRVLALGNGDKELIEQYAHEFDVKLLSYPYKRWQRTPTDLCSLLSHVLYYQTRQKVISDKEEFLARKHIVRLLRIKNPKALEMALRDIYEEVGKRMKNAGYDHDESMIDEPVKKWFSYSLNANNNYLTA